MYGEDSVCMVVILNSIFCHEASLINDHKNSQHFHLMSTGLPEGIDNWFTDMQARKHMYVLPDRTRYHSLIHSHTHMYDMIIIGTIDEVNRYAIICTTSWS